MAASCRKPSVTRSLGREVNAGSVSDSVSALSGDGKMSISGVMLDIKLPILPLLAWSSFE
jgi:hypothetical protein